jgi:hypothetical protein
VKLIAVQRRRVDPKPAEVMAPAGLRGPIAKRLADAERRYAQRR